ncbi:hypothetical protein ACQ4PT_041134 [Festuca glaucescens]
MERGRDGRNDPFGAGGPFAGFGAGLGPLGSSMPSLFGGRDPFDDPFFTQPFGGRMGGPGMLGPGLFGPMGGPGMFGAFGAGDEFLEQAPQRSNNPGRPVITEIDDDEGEDGERGERQANHEHYVQEPDDGNDGGQVQLRRDPNRANGGGQPQSRTFTYQSSSVTYGGINGAYYTASKTRRSGSDGITVEESKEADTTTKEATHRISRGIHDKGHSLTKKLKADGKVDSTQILHNLDEDELPVFEESWKGNAGQHLPGWSQNAGISIGDNSGLRNGTYEMSLVTVGWIILLGLPTVTKDYIKFQIGCSQDVDVAADIFSTTMN